MIDRFTITGVIVLVIFSLLAMIGVYFNYENGQLKDQIELLKANNYKLNEVVENRDNIINIYEKQFEIASTYANEKKTIKNHYYKTVKERETIIKTINSKPDKVKMAEKAKLFNKIFEQIK